MGIATFLSRIMGLVREQVFAVMFGAGNATDAYYVAFRIPNLLRDLFAEGAMSASLVPTFTQTQAQEGERRAWRVAGLVFRILFVTVAVFALLGIVFAPELVSLYASAFKQVPGKYELTVQMTRIMFPFFPLVALAAAFMGILNARGVFFLPSFASALFNLASVISGVVIAKIISYTNPSYGFHPIVGMAVGVVIGGGVQAFCQLPSLYRHGYRWTGRGPEDPKWSEDPRLKQMLWMMVPGTVGLAATQVNLLVNTVLATSQGTGAVSWLGYAFRLMQFPIGIFGVSIASATLPVISRQWVNQSYGEVEKTLSQSLRHVFAINLPASAGLAFLGYPIIQLIFQYGRFYPEDTHNTALALAMYSVGLTAYSAVKVLVPACYAFGNTRIPVISSVLAVALTIALNLAMIGPFGYWGLALGTSIAAVFNAGFLLYSVRKMIGSKGGSFPLFPIFKSFLENLAVALAMGIVVFFSHKWLTALLPDRIFLENFGHASLPFSRAFKVSLIIGEALLVLIFLARVFKLRDITDSVDLFLGKILNKLKRLRS